MSNEQVNAFQVMNEGRGDPSERVEVYVIGAPLQYGKVDGARVIMGVEIEYVEVGITAKL